MMYQITKNCIGCHNCAGECPMQAIDWVGSKYEIDQDKCVECGLCAKVCHTHSIIDVDADETVPAHGEIVLEADVVVCGGGTGLIAAVKTAMAGKKVILLEKADRLGGNTDYAHAYFPVYTKWHENAGMPDVREQAIEHYDRATDGIIGKDIFRTAVYATGEFFDWLCEFGRCEEVYNLVNLGDADAHGPIYGPGLLDFPKRMWDNLNCRDEAIGPGYGGTHIKYSMLRAIEQYGLPVDIYLEHEACELLLDDSGAISGVLAKDPGGVTRVNAPVVILSTGGFGKNDELLKELAPWFFDGAYIHRFTVPTDTGDGITMLRRLGVEPVRERTAISGFGPKHHPWSNVLAELALEPEMLQVNMAGERWTDESRGDPQFGAPLHAMTALIGDQPGQISWAIQGREVFKMAADRTLSFPPMAKRWWQFHTWEGEFKEECALPEPPCYEADTLEELAGKIGMPTDALLATVSAYNKAAAGLCEDKFGKKAPALVPVPDHGPYYAVKGQRFSEAALGGLMVDAKCRVLRNDSSFIPGLYGTGDATSAMHIAGRLAVISELTWAVASTYTAAVEGVAYINAKGGAN